MNGTVAPYQALIIAGNKSGGGSRKIQLYDDVSLPLAGSKFCIGSTCINEAQLKQLTDSTFATKTFVDSANTETNSKLNFLQTQINVANGKIDNTLATKTYVDSNVATLNTNVSSNVASINNNINNNFVKRNTNYALVSSMSNGRISAASDKYLWWDNARPGTAVTFQLQ